MAAQSTGKELASGEARLWFESFRSETPEALTDAFRDFFLGRLVDPYGKISGNYFPHLAEIEQLLERRRRRTAEQLREENQKRLLEDMRNARRQQEAEGKPVGLAQLREVLRQCCERVKRMP